MQISIPQIRHFNDLYYISVNLLHIQKKTASARLTCKSYFVYYGFYAYCYFASNSAHVRDGSIRGGMLG